MTIDVCIACLTIDCHCVACGTRGTVPGWCRSGYGYGDGDGYGEDVVS